jgi:hypothetical protein
MVSSGGIEYERKGQLAWQRNEILVATPPRIDIPDGGHRLKPSDFS